MFNASVYGMFHFYIIQVHKGSTPQIFQNQTTLFLLALVADE